MTDDYEIRRAHRRLFMYNVPIFENWGCPRDKVVLMNEQMFAHPSVAMAIRVGRTPLWTRHMRGVIEAERDQRRRAKGRR